MALIDQPLEMRAASVADVALAFPQAISILAKYNLDYCCNGKVLFTEACSQANRDPLKVWSEVQQLSLKGRGNLLHFENWNSSVLVDFIVQHHHEYVRDAIPQISDLLNKICEVHGDTNPELLTVKKAFNDLAEELIGHLPKEEQILFPAIKRIEGQPIASVESEISPSALSMPIQVMEDEHDRAGQLIKSIRALTHQYTTPSYACPTYQLAFTMLREFDDDLIQHIHLENNILFPRYKSGSTHN